MLSTESQFSALGPSPAGGLSFPALACPTVGIFILHRRKPRPREGQCTESGAFRTAAQVSWSLGPKSR